MKRVFIEKIKSDKSSTGFKYSLCPMGTSKSIFSSPVFQTAVGYASRNDYEITNIIAFMHDNKI